MSRRRITRENHARPPSAVRLDNIGTMHPKAREPIVFISSTAEDLKLYREAAQEAALRARFRPDMMEYFIAGGKEPPLGECLAKVSGSDVVVVLVAHRFGWKPSEPPGDGSKSVTWLECELAISEGKDVLAFLVDEDYPWPPKQVQPDGHRLGEFKTWLANRRFRELFTTPEDLRGKVESALREWRGGGQHGTDVEARFDLAGYANAILRLYQRLRLDALDVSGQDYGVRLRKVFVPQDVREGLPYYDTPKDLQKRLQHQGAAEKEMALDDWDELRRRYLDSPTKSIQAVLHDPERKHLVFVGDPGSGKSSLAQSLLLQWVESREQPLPILIELRGYTQDIGKPRSFLQYLEDGEGCAWHFHQHELDEWLRTRPTFMIFEGLDEVFDPVRRHEATRSILRFATEYPNARIMVTSRSVGYRPQELRNGGFEHFTLQDFSGAQIDTFLELWHEEAIVAVSDRLLLAKRLRQSLSESPSLRELAGNPLLLTMLAMLNRNQELPRDRAEAYEQMSRVLLYQWDVNKFLREHGSLFAERIGRHEKEEILRRVALKVQTASPGKATNLISRSDLEGVITAYLRDVIHQEHGEVGARLIIQQLRERNFVLCQAGAEYFAFVHRTFLEYFCASAFVKRFLEDLSLERVQLEAFRAHWREESWREVLTLIVGMLPVVHALKLIEGLLDQPNPERDFENVFLAAACWRDVVQSGGRDVVRRRLWRALVAVADFRPAGLAYPVDNMGTVIPRRESHLIWTVSVRTRAVATIGATFAGDPQALDWLKGCLTNRQTWALRQAAVRALATSWPGAAEVGVWIRWAARSDEDENVRITAVRETARGWKEEPDTLVWLKTLAESDESVAIRNAATQELIRGWARDTETTEFLASLAEPSPQ